ncbi:MarR family winged helix-turn-helix transcriptional regulator [Mycolicibacterium sp. CBMA 226]|uniref:MarR family winged helix-turn-helix transcriptional regulator n=1 Tax=Mycolicibacterium sp. CBMA 226 TaxID=2606611 RepID=UPI0012DFAF30|nr:MarR family transcriptional regulator [Mycolicibacterium sp. CBMA 226]MUL78985.1 MarR family transcriptional regulator [Mycolicibacterium sp. CBMA 226]QGW61297.1 putative HTH-type transcriptional regulator [Mycolicibacterium sp.]
MVDSEATGAEEPLAYLLHRVQEALRAETRVAVLDAFELGFTQYICLRMLSRSPETSTAELARESNVSPQAMNKIVLGLQNRGLVTRPVMAAKGRTLPARLSHEGAKVLHRVDLGVCEAERRFLAQVSGSDGHTLRRILLALGGLEESGLSG